jgi:hypothetical protein
MQRLKRAAEVTRDEQRDRPGQGPRPLQHLLEVRSVDVLQDEVLVPPQCEAVEDRDQIGVKHRRSEARGALEALECHPSLRPVAGEPPQLDTAPEPRLAPEQQLPVAVARQPLQDFDAPEGHAARHRHACRLLRGVGSGART